MEVIWHRQGLGLIPADLITENLVRQVRFDKIVSTSRPQTRRHPKNHKFMMAILAKVVENSRFMNVDDLMHHLKIESRMFRAILVRDDRVFCIPKSISFASMGEEKFQEVKDEWLYIISTEILPGIGIEDLLEEARRDL